jgi:hypothetical protein
MRNRIRGGVVRALCLSAAVLTVGASVTRADPKETAFSLSMGTDFTSHFISYGVDVWGGGSQASPFGDRRTEFGYATVGMAFTDAFSGFINVWGDINDNGGQPLGGNIQEIDLNVGLAYTWNKFSFSIAHGCWNYAQDTEHIIDFTVGYGDADMMAKGFSLNPSFTVHGRYNGNGAQDTGAAFVPGIKPSYTLLSDSKFPLTLSLPTSVAFFTDNFQGGSSGYGYFSCGPAVSVGMGFIPPKYGVWSVSASVIYYNTPSDSIPTNPKEDFIVTTLSVGVSM